jgi:hypothetical protein
MALTAREQRVLELIAHHTREDDPALCRRLAEFSGPSRWAGWPAALVAGVLALAAFALPIVGASQAAGATGGRASIPSANGK